MTTSGDTSEPAERVVRGAQIIELNGRFYRQDATGRTDEVPITEALAARRGRSPRYPTAAEARLRLLNKRNTIFARGCLLVMIAAVASALLDGVGNSDIVVFAASVAGYVASCVIGAFINRPEHEQ